MNTATTSETPQHMIALQKANRVRHGHGELKREVLAGRLGIAEALDDPRAVGRLTLGQLLSAQARWGVYRTRKFCYRVSIPEGRRADALTERQKRVVLEALA